MSALPQFPAANDPDALETQEWLDALEAVLEREGPERAHYLLEKLIDKARRSGAPCRSASRAGSARAPDLHEKAPPRARRAIPASLARRDRSRPEIEGART